jgi:phage terminase large subunit-like protein
MGRKAKVSSRDFMSDLSDSFISGNTGEVVDIITFAQSPWGLNFKLLPVQIFILKAFYGIHFDNEKKSIPVPDVVNEKILYEMTESEFAQWLYDEKRCNTKEIGNGKTFRELVLAVGRRGSKSTLASVMSCYEMYKLIKHGDPAAYYGFPPEQRISICNVAPTDDQANIVFNAIQSLAAKSLCLRDRLLNQTQTYFNMRTDADISASQFSAKERASIVVMAGGCSSGGLRGHNNIAIILDEMAFFIDNGGRFSGEAVYKALTPSTASFKGDGKIICISSPYAKYGAFYDRYTKSFDETDTTLMFKMYSSLVNPGVDPVLLKTERRRDKVNFLCEFGGEFSDAVVAWIDDEKTFRECVHKRPIPTKGVTNEQYFMGVDLSSKNDGTSIAIVHRDHESKKIILDYADVFFSSESDVWDSTDSIYAQCTRYKELEFIKINDIAKDIQELSKWFPIRDGWFDQWTGYALLEQLHNMGMKQFRVEQVTDTLNSNVYTLAKSLYMEGLLDLFDHPVLVPEMLGLEAEHKAKNKVKVRAPNKKGAHDDISDAFVRAVWACFNWDKERQVNLTTLVGGSSPSDGSSQTYNMHRYEKIMKHGVNPRDVRAGRRVR